MTARMAIATWFVADTPEEATCFPAIGMRSADAGAAAIYWRCVATFYATSLAHNPNHPHLFFTNSDPPRVDGIAIGDLLRRWGVQIVRLPVAHRLRTGAVRAWGNQFYIFDIIAELASRSAWPAALILDADVVVTAPLDAFEAVVMRDGLATYLPYRDDADRPVNGRTSADLTAFLRAEAGYGGAPIRYSGGEIFAATLPVIRRIAARAPPLWRATLADAPGAPREEAHLLSALYALEGLPGGGADAFIKRMWTAFRFRNVTEADLALPLWHLPAEKLYGFETLFRRLGRCGLARKMPANLRVDRAELAEIFGVPGRSPRKWARDLTRRATRDIARMLRKSG